MKTVFVIALLSVIYFGSILAQDCASKTNCDACSTLPGCGWCAPTQSCLEGTKAGPNNSTCVGLAWEFDHCIPCGQFSDCRSCNARESDCFWCPASNNGLGGCQNLGFVGCDYDRTCPCGEYGSCFECTNDMTCQWCGTSATCVSSNTTCNGTQPSFNYTTECPCAGNRDCPNCRATGGCQWCASGECSEACTGPVVLSCAIYCNNVGNGSCDTCTASHGCAWCGSTKKCVDAATNPCDYTYTCPSCSAASYCDTCQSVDGCVWCEDVKTCQPYGTSCLTAISCNAYCETYSSCDACSAARGCGWCDDVGNCQDLSVANCFFTHSCSQQSSSSSGHVEKKCGFNGGSFVGGMFFVIGVAVLVFGLWFFYRWRTGRKFDYKELH